LLHVECILIAGVQKNHEGIVLFGNVSLGEMDDECAFFIVHGDFLLGRLGVGGGEQDREGERGDAQFETIHS
jgi:hypothetical protein